MLASLKEVIALSKGSGRAVGSFNTPNLECLLAVLSAAEQLPPETYYPPGLGSVCHLPFTNLLRDGMKKASPMASLWRIPLLSGIYL